MKNILFGSLALGALFVGGLFLGESVKASANTKQLRMGFNRFSIITPAGPSGTWETGASATVTAKRDNGSCHVSSSGMIVLPPGTELTLTLNTSPASRGPWVFSTSNFSGASQETEIYNVEMVFGDIAGPNIASSYYLNATFFSGPGGANVQMGSLVAVAIQNPLTEDCDPGFPFAPGEEPGFPYGASNLDPGN